MQSSIITWERIGHVFRPSGGLAWACTHAANPVPELLADGGLRVYFGARDDRNRTSIGAIMLSPEPGHPVVSVGQSAALGPGPIGTFDDSGTSMGCLVDAGGATYLYYVGWNLGVTVPWRNSIGLAVRPHGTDRFERQGNAPVLDRSAVDPYSLSYPWVLRDGGLWRMWYGSNLSWGAHPTDMTHVIKYAESTDGIAWTPTGRIAVEPRGDGEFAVSRPCVIRDPDGWRMWFSSRGNGYRIGYAESPDGIRWDRIDGVAGLQPGDADWEDREVAYAAVFDYLGRRHMLYNGNDYGRSGFGLAVASVR